MCIKDILKDCAAMNFTFLSNLNYSNNGAITGLIQMARVAKASSI